jgi:CelD/BcsL family acetyltransferase involved in cellulose biosynthesis
VWQASALAPHAEAWDRLAERAADPSHVLGHAYVGSQLEGRRSGTWSCLLAFVGRALVGVVALLADPFELFGRSGVRLATPASLACAESDALVDPEWTHPAYRALLGAVVRRWPLHASLALGGVRDSSPTNAFLAAPGCPWRSTSLPPAAREGSGRRLLVRGSLDDYRDTLGQNHRRNLRKARNRAEEAGVAFRILRGAEARAGLLEEFLALEAAGWKGREGTAIGASSEARAFYARLVGRAAGRGWLEWHVVAVGGRPAAMHLAFRLGRTLLLHRIAYDETHARLAPGNLLFEHVLADAFAGRVTDAVDCMTNMPWHDLWHLEHYGYRRVRLHAPRPVSQAARLGDLAVRWLRARTGACGGADFADVAANVTERSAPVSASPHGRTASRV